MEDFPTLNVSIGKYYNLLKEGKRATRHSVAALEEEKMPQILQSDHQERDQGAREKKSGQ